MKPGRFAALAAALVEGPSNGSPRSREQLLREVEQALDRAYESGKTDAAPAAREAALREMVHVHAGWERALAAMAHTVKAELRDIEQKSGKTISG